MAHQEEIFVNGVLIPVTALDSSAQEVDDVVEKFPSHADRHSASGADPITPHMIDAFGASATNITGTDLVDVLTTGKSDVYKGYNVTNAPDLTTFWVFIVTATNPGYAVVTAIDLYKANVVKTNQYIATATPCLGEWKTLATTDYAVNKAGDTMTGALQVNGGFGEFIAWDGGAAIDAKLLNGKVSRLQSLVSDSGANANIAFFDGTKWVGHDILHTGNKPSGSYTGNGDATARTIETGGIGSVCVVSVYQGLMLVSNTGAVFFRFDQQVTKYYDSTQIKFVSGVLTISSDDAYINYTGADYSYWVL